MGWVFLAGTAILIGVIPYLLFAILFLWRGKSELKLILSPKSYLVFKELISFDIHDIESYVTWIRLLLANHILDPAQGFIPAHLNTITPYTKGSMEKAFHIKHSATVEELIWTIPLLYALKHNGVKSLSQKTTEIILWLKSIIRAKGYRIFEFKKGDLYPSRPLHGTPTSHFKSGVIQKCWGFSVEGQGGILFTPFIDVT